MADLCLPLSANAVAAQQALDFQALGADLHHRGCARRQLRRGQRALVGISLGNSYFSAQRLQDLLPAIVRHFAQSWILIVDQPAIANYRACGYSLDRAKAKAAKQADAMRRRVAQALQGISSSRWRQVDWQSPECADQLHHQRYRDVCARLAEQEDFAAAVDGLAYRVLQHLAPERAHLAEARQLASEYVLQECAFLDGLDDLMGGEALILYHKEDPFFTQYLAGSFGGSRQAYASYELQAVPDLALAG